MSRDEMPRAGGEIESDNVSNNIPRAVSYTTPYPSSHQAAGGSETVFGGVLRAPKDKAPHEIWVTVPGPVTRGTGMLRLYQSLIMPKSGSSCNVGIAMVIDSPSRAIFNFSATKNMKWCSIGPVQPRLVEFSCAQGFSS